MLSEYTQEMMRETARTLRRNFVWMNTDPFATYEDDGTRVHKIRYEGATGSVNRFGLR